MVWYAVVKPLIKSCSKSRWDKGEADVSDPFRYHHRTSMLSVHVRVFLYWIS